MPIVEKVASFLNHYCSASAPLLLAFSGGPDSLCLFYSLLACQKQQFFPFHVAHVDHSWRQESQKEAEILRELAHQHHIPFHLKTLVPSREKGNLEAICRDARYQFFSELCQFYGFQGVLLGHQRDDQAETVLKRLLEGSHWKCFSGLKLEGWREEMRLLRPLLSFSKKDIYQFLQPFPFKAFEDPTNQDTHFLRARMRQEIIPWLDQAFGKKVQSALIGLAQDMDEIHHYFDGLLADLLATVVRGPWGIYLDLQKQRSLTSVEIKYLLRRLCEQEGFFLSRMQVDKAAEALLSGKANQSFEMGKRKIWIDRKRVFLTTLISIPCEKCLLSFDEAWVKGKWKLEASLLSDYPTVSQSSSWQEAWQGKFEVILPVGSYSLNFSSFQTLCANSVFMKRWWERHKVPAFLKSFFPVIWRDNEIFHEFLSGKQMVPVIKGQACMKICLSYT